MDLRQVIADHYGPMTAAAYDRMAATYFWAYDETLGAIAAELLFGRRPGPAREASVPHRILDIGTGTGNLAARIIAERERVLSWEGLDPQSSPLEILAVDGSPHMLEQARAKLERSPGVTLNTQICRIQDLPQTLEGRSFDAIVSSFAIHHLSGTEKAELFRGLRRLLNPQGLLIIGDRVEGPRDYHAVVAQKFHELFRTQGLNPSLDAVMTDLDRGFERDGDQPSSIEDHLRWLTDAGFAEARCPFQSFGCAVVSGRASSGHPA